MKAFSLFCYELTQISSFPPTERLFHQNQCKKKYQPISTFHSGRGINEGARFAHSCRRAVSFFKTTQPSSVAANDQHAAGLWAVQFTQSSHRSSAPGPQVGFGMAQHKHSPGTQRFCSFPKRIQNWAAEEEKLTSAASPQGNWK